MRVKDFMQTDVITVSSHDSIYDALKLFKEKKIRRMPVVDKGRLVGIVTRKALREASPSKVTSLSMHELNYLLAKMTIKDIMRTKVKTITPDTAIETAGYIMHKDAIGGLPVMEGDISIDVDSYDVFNAIVKINGLDKPVSRITMEVPANDCSSAIFKCLEILGKENCAFRMMSLMPSDVESKKLLIFRFKAGGNLEQLAQDLRDAGFHVVSVFENVMMV